MAKQKAARLNGVKVRPGDEVVVTFRATVRQWSDWSLQDNGRPDELELDVKGGGYVSLYTDDCPVPGDRDTGVTIVPVKGE